MYANREEAGRKLGEALSFLKGNTGAIVLAIPRGGVVVARQVADLIGAPLDVVITRKIGAPGNPELAIGAVNQEGEPTIDTGLARMLGVPDDYVRREAAKKTEEVKSRLRSYRGDAPFPPLEGRTVVIVDDGIATGSTARAAVESVRTRRPAAVILAAPVGSEQATEELSRVADRVVCLSTPEPFYAIGAFYDDFEQVDDETVRRLLKKNSTGGA